MDLETAKLFHDIAQTRSLSKAATLNDVSQSAVSQQVQELERTLGVMLLDRSRRPVLVTPAGEIYARFCSDVLQRKADLDDALAELRNQVEGAVRVASIYSVGMSELVQFERTFTERHPHAEVALLYLRPEKVYEAVLEDRADIGLVSYPEPRRDLNVLPWRREEMVVAASPDHPLAKLAAKVQGPLPVEELRGIDFIGFDEELPIRHHVDEFLREREVEVNLAMHFDNIEMVKEAVAHRMGVGILPYRSMREEIRQKRLTAIRLAGETLYRPVGIIHRKKKRLNRVGEAFLEMLHASAAPEA